MLLQVLIKFQKYWNPHENSFGLFSSFHEVSVEQIPDCWGILEQIPDYLLDVFRFPNHSKYQVYRIAPQDLHYQVYRIAPLKSGTLLRSFLYTPSVASLDQDSLQEVRIKWSPQI